MLITPWTFDNTYRICIYIILYIPIIISITKSILWPTSDTYVISLIRDNEWYVYIICVCCTILSCYYRVFFHIVEQQMRHDNANSAVHINTYSVPRNDLNQSCRFVHWSIRNTFNEIWVKYETLLFWKYISKFHHNTYSITINPVKSVHVFVMLWFVVVKQSVPGDCNLFTHMLQRFFTNTVLIHEGPSATQPWGIYRKTFNKSRTFVGNKTVDQSDVVGASPVGAPPTTSSFPT